MCQDESLACTKIHKIYTYFAISVFIDKLYNTIYKPYLLICLMINALEIVEAPERRTCRYFTVGQYTHNSQIYKMFTIAAVLVLILSAITIVVVKIFTEEGRGPIFNVYQRPTKAYWLKVVFMYIVIRLRLLKNYFKSERLRQLGNEDKYQLLEKPQKLSSHNSAIDAVFFNGANSNGDHLIVGTARRKNKLIDGFIYLKINDSKLGVLESPKLPSTVLYQIEETQEYKAEGIEIKVLEPMKKWRISYEGKMKKADDRSKSVDVKINGIWTSNLPIYNADSDMDPLMTAKAMAVEPWSRDYFKIVNTVHQTHYEQFGDMKVHVSVDGTCYNFNLDVLRDHSVGHKREWRNFHRYALHFITVKNGDRIMVGIISTPISFSCITMGFVYSASDNKMYPIENCDLILHQHGENGEPPVDYGFSVTAGHQNYVIKVHVKDNPHFYISKDWEAKIYERLCSFNVNGLNAWGATEWMYRNIEGKHVEDYEKNKHHFI